MPELLFFSNLQDSKEDWSEFQRMISQPRGLPNRGRDSVLGSGQQVHKQLDQVVSTQASARQIDAEHITAAPVPVAIRLVPTGDIRYCGA